MDYEEYSEKRRIEHESLCMRCGACCGILNDPCQHLKKDDSQHSFFCSIYQERHGMHETISGESFHCVDIREILHENWLGKENCAYFKRVSSAQLVMG
jgi:hypothetical protein